MNARAYATPLVSAPAAALPGTWKLARGRAVTLRPARDGILRVAAGRLWATRDGPHGVSPQDAGDHILEAGRAMLVRAGERVVIEAWTRGEPAHFGWDPVFLPVRSRLDFAAVRQPLAELRAAFALALHALGALGRGLAQLGWQALHGGGGREFACRRPHCAPG